MKMPDKIPIKPPIRFIYEGTLFESTLYLFEDIFINFSILHLK